MHDTQDRPPVCIKHSPTLRAVVVNDGPISGHANRLKLLISSSVPLISILEAGDAAGFDARSFARSLALKIPAREIASVVARKLPACA
jgi:hypothetical protein